MQMDMESRYRCRAPFNPKSGHGGEAAAPRSCKPQAHLKPNHLGTFTIYHLSLGADEIGQWEP
jgi:hypothetical protein